MDGVAAGSAERERVYSIGDLAGELGLSQRAIRFYEDHGLIRPRRAGGNRVYSPRDRARLILIQRGKRLGFSLSDIGELLDLYDADPLHLEQKRRALAKSRARIAALEQQRAALDETLDELRGVEAALLAAIGAAERSLE